MPKLVSPPFDARRRAQRRLVTIRDRTRGLYEHVDRDRSLGDSTQRAIARGRRAIVEAQCRMLRFTERRPKTSGDHSLEPDQIRALNKLAGRLKTIHLRLLKFSTSVEREMDRLDVTRAEIERLA